MRFVIAAWDPQRPHGAATSQTQGGHAHGAQPAGPGSARTAYAATMARMHQGMDAALDERDADVSFVKGMIAHHQGAIDMARIQLQHGKDPANNQLAQHIIAEQERELAQMKEWLRRRGS
ncbi:DUF305 domain-containing protein [Ramlibacter henchirensis]|uniref:DUF305 domain-containing protein n=2 Tax=Ramlibacter henchirensis TaxID=204072 RepID=A0A4Z0BQE8_9BURK|nr:DUF305 domain-containing protein [Ramlibacter henchirensis]